MKQVKKVNDALDVVKECLGSLLKRKAELETIISEKNTAINQLMSLAVSLNDFCEYIPHFVKEYGRNEFSRMVSEVRGGTRGWHYMANIESETKGRHLSLSHFEDEFGNIDTDSLLVGMEGKIYDNAGINVMKKLCFFFPEIISGKLIELFKSSDVEWGYEDNMPVAERRVKIAELVSERTEAQCELDGVVLEIGRIDRLTDAIPRAPKEEPESIYGRCTGPHGMVIEISDDGLGQAYATIS